MHSNKGVIGDKTLVSLFAPDGGRRQGGGGRLSRRGGGRGGVFRGHLDVEGEVGVDLALVVANDALVHAGRLLGGVGHLQPALVVRLALLLHDPGRRRLHDRRLLEEPRALALSLRLIPVEIIKNYVST